MDDIVNGIYDLVYLTDITLYLSALVFYLNLFLCFYITSLALIGRLVQNGLNVLKLATQVGKFAIGLASTTSWEIEDAGEQVFRRITAMLRFETNVN